MTTARIQGPSDLSIFRDDPTSWKTYTDPLPPCELAPGHSDYPVTVPSVSTIKAVDPKFGLLPWVAKEVALSAHAHRHQLADMAEDATVDLLSRAADRKRDSAAERGHIIHEALEHLVDGKPIGIGLDAGHDADKYMDCLRQLVADLRPEIVAAEVVVFGNGYAGTFDAIWLVTQHLADTLKLDQSWVGHNVIVDYKTRKPTKAATRDAMEGAQLGGYSDGVYWIVEDDTGIHRMAPLPVVGALLLSIAPDGYAPYAVNIEHARNHWSAVLAWYQAQQGATAMFSRGRTVKIVGTNDATPAVHPVGPGPIVGSKADETQSGSTPDVATQLEQLADTEAECGVVFGDHQRRTAWMLDRIDVIKAADGALQVFAEGWPDGMPKPAAVRDGAAAWTAEHLDWLAKSADLTEARFEIPFGVLDPTLPKDARVVGLPTPPPAVEGPRQFTAPTTDDDLPPVDPDTVNALRAELAALPADQVATVLAWSRAATEHGVGWAMVDEPCPMRNYMCAAAAVAIARDTSFPAFDDVMFTDIDGVPAPVVAAVFDEALTISPGVAIGLLTAEQCDDLINRLRTHAGTTTATAA